ncbi:hypothetical protein [Actinomycetospora lemnae]|uniref:Uncharacterized protein n=1 Tax=Actinomycetospora lemnae TaxID=3019891 RepID=A0ABT5T2R5_9PSEU|nr:hypothetical protein [Actinomycetospora sp. DW7H6]MDD7969386.1 hypothetical protein [Actinomycetospora sp. DW7H6]
MTAVITLDGRSGARPLSYCIAESPHRIVVSTPRAEPDLWEEYLDGAARSYAAHGVTGVVELDRVREGAATALFFVALSADDRVVAGLRSQGPYTSADQAHAVAEWDGHPDQPLVRALIEERLPFGVVESKTVWVERDVPGRREIVTGFARVPLHASMILGARYAFGTAAAHALPMWAATGALAVGGLATTGYPDVRYRTNLLWWDRWDLPATVPDGVRRALDLETAQLLSPAIPTVAW